MKNVLLLLFVAAVVGQLAAQNYPIGHKQFNFVDPARNRTIQTEVYYPATSAGDNTPFANGQFPLLVFGHGFAMSWDSYEWLWDSIVPKGYIMAFPRTEGSVIPAPDHEAFGLDLKFLNDFILSEGNNSSSFFYQHIIGTSAIMGHSMGGGSSFLAAANNTNLTALINFAAAETNPSAIAAAANVTVPAMVMYGLNDGVAPPADHQIPMYNALASSCKNLVGIIGGGHCYFADYNFNCSFGEGTTNPQPTITREQQHQIIAQILFPYLDFMLKNDLNAEQIFYQRLNTLNTITFQRNCLMNHDLAITRFISPSNECSLNSNQLISVVIKNLGANPASNFLLSYVVNGQQAVNETYNGTLNPGDSVVYTFSTTVDAGTPGATYTFTAYVTYQLDEYVYNNELNVTYTNTTVALPISVDFTGFDGSNLSTVFPGWREAQGIVPSGTTSTWVNRTGVGGTSNATAKVNFYGSPIREWILGPGFLCGPYTHLYFDVAVTAFNSTAPYSNGMGTYDSLIVFYSLDCGNNWHRLTAFGKNAGFNHNLQTIDIDLSQFNGMGIAIGFQAFRQTSVSNDYDLHIDNILIKHEHPYDLMVEELISPVIKNCFGQENVEVKIKNAGVSSIDFSQNPATIEVLVNNGIVYNETITINTGQLSAGSSITIPFPSINMSAAGMYDFSVSIYWSIDENSSNNFLQKTLYSTNPVVSIDGSTIICSGNQTTLTANAYASGDVLKTFVNNTPLNIPNNYGTGVTSTMNVNVPTSVVASSIVEISIDSLIHPYIGDVKIDLIAPDNSSINIFNRRGSNGDNMIGTVFTMNATTPIASGTAPFTGEFLPEQSLANLTGTASGNWQLKVTDLGIGDVGTLHKWSIKFMVQNEIVTYSWSNGSTSPSITISPTNNEAYTVTVTDLNGCTAEATANVIVSGQAGTIYLGNDTTICQGQSVVLDAGPNYQSYYWNTGEQTQSIVVSTSGTYYVQAQDACGMVADTIVVTVNSLPNASLNDVTACVGDNVTLELTNACATYTWSNGSSANMINVSTNVAGTSTYTVTVVDCNGCSSTGMSTVTINPNPVVNLGNDTTICTTDDLILNAGQHSSYNWSTGETSSSIIIDASQYNTGTYTFSVLVANEFGCTAWDTIQVTIDLCNEINNNQLAAVRIYPNPAKDFLVVENCMKGSVVETYNQLGQLVYTTVVTDKSLVIPLNHLPSGVYVIKIIDGVDNYSKSIIKE